MKRKLLLPIAVVAIVLVTGFAVRKTGQSLRAYVGYEKTVSDNELSILREMRIGHNDAFPGIYVWLGDDRVIEQDLAGVRAGEESAYSSVGDFVLPFTHQADLKKCVTDLHEKHLDSLRALDRLTESHHGPDELADRYLSVSRTYRGQLATCGVLLAGFSPPDMSTRSTTSETSAANESNVPASSERTSGVERSYKDAYSKLRSSKPTSEVTDADMTALAGILAHPATEADWRFLSEIDAAEADPDNSCNTGDCAIDQNIVGTAERMIKAAGLVPPPSMSVHLKLAQ